MGVSGAGKSTLGRALSARRGVPFIEGDDLHTDENRVRMAAGIALSDEDRLPWLDAVGSMLANAALAKGEAVGSCSALRRSYRDRLRTVSGQPILFLHLSADRALLRERILQRPDHYMPASLLESQLAVLEPPDRDEWSTTLVADQPLARLIEVAEAALEQGPHAALP
jgi:carbohydrate kinase (thermoresistant glucokinase family)